jgi:hypothetical protein
MAQSLLTVLSLRLIHSLNVELSDSLVLSEALFLSVKLDHSRAWVLLLLLIRSIRNGAITVVDSLFRAWDSNLMWLGSDWIRVRTIESIPTHL